MLSCEISKSFSNTYFEEHLRTTADQMTCNKILFEKIRAVFSISIKFDLNVRKTGWKKIRFQLALNKTYSLTPPPLIHRRFKHHQRTKINKTMLSASSDWTRIASVGVLNWVSTVYATTDSEHKFQKTRIENWLPIGFILALITTTLCSIINGKSLDV